MEVGEHSYQENEDLPQSMAFTVTFDSATSMKSTGRAINNSFVKRHFRNLSLPITREYTNTSVKESPVNGKGPKQVGNHSEGYFSSDPDDDQINSKMMVSEMNKCNGNDWCAETPDGEDADSCESDAPSETGTYTVDKDSEEVITARLNIDAAFGLDPSPALCRPKQPSIMTSRDSPNWISDWASQVISHNEKVGINFKINKPALRQTTRPNSAPRPLCGNSKIPSPAVMRSRFATGINSCSTKIDEIGSNNKCLDGTQDTEQYLRTTEQVVEALTARLSMDSESEPEGQQVRSTDSSTSESHKSSVAKAGAHSSLSSITVAKTNKVPSLQGSRLDDTSCIRKGVTHVKRKDPASGGNSSASSTSSFKKPLPPTVVRPVTTPVLARTDPGRFSMRGSKHPTSPQLGGKPVAAVGATTMTSIGVKKKPVVGGARSNSTLSSKEVEFQNWKRRKSYDPMKAAAEGKKKEARKSNITLNQQPSPVSVVPSATVVNPAPTASVLRSASFHGTRQLGSGTAVARVCVPSSSDDDEDHIPPNETPTQEVEQEDWPQLQVPRSSRETTPLGSRVSLFSGNSTNSPGRGTRHKLEGVENLVISAVSNLSGKIKFTGSSLLRKLRCLYDEDSEKSKRLKSEIEQLEILEAVSTPSSPSKSPSKELASTLRNLRRIDSMLKVLDEVLFDSTEYE